MQRLATISRLCVSRFDQKVAEGRLIFPFNLLLQIASGMECPCFNSGHGQAKPKRDFSTCKTLEFAEENDDSQLFPKL